MIMAPGEEKTQSGETGTPDFETSSATNYIILGKGFHLFDLVLHLEIEMGMASSQDGCRDQNTHSVRDS